MNESQSVQSDIKALLCGQHLAVLSTRSADGGPYRRRDPVLRAVGLENQFGNRLERALRRALERYDRDLGLWRGAVDTIDPALLTDEESWREALAEAIRGQALAWSVARATASSGIRPTRDRTFRGTLPPSGRCKTS